VLYDLRHPLLFGRRVMAGLRGEIPEGIEQANRESGSGPRGADSQRQVIKEQPGTTEDPSAD
jgi:hypothetical protein